MSIIILGRVCINDRPYTLERAVGAAAALSDKLNYLSIEGLNVYRFGYIPAEAFGDKALLAPIYVRYKD